MRIRLTVRLASVVLSFCPMAPAAHAEKWQDLPRSGCVSDFAGVLSAQFEQRFSALCEEVWNKAEAAMVLVTIRTLEGVPIEEFANRLYERWGIGRPPENRGVLLLYTIEDRQYRIEVGYGLEPILPDGRVGSFARSAVPLLRADDYDGALWQVAARIAEVIAADRGVTLATLAEAPPVGSRSDRAPPSAPEGIPWLLSLLLFFGFWGFWIWLLARGRRSRFRGRRGWGGWYVGPAGWGRGGFGGSGGFGGFGGGISGGGGASGGW
jgi:uncharacterized protein